MNKNSMTDGMHIIINLILILLFLSRDLPFCMINTYNHVNPKSIFRRRFQF